MLFVGKDKRLEMKIEDHYSLNMIEDKYEIFAYEVRPYLKTEYKVEIVIQQQKTSYYLFNSK
jgi:hypothetical protein